MDDVKHINAREFQQLFSDVKSNRSHIVGIIKRIVDVAIVRIDHHPNDYDDLKQDAFVRCMLSLDKYNPNSRKANAFHYFLTCAMREIKSQAIRRSSQKSRNTELPTVETARSYRNKPDCCGPILRPKHRRLSQWALRRIDRSIEHARIAHINSGGEESAITLTALDTLQCMRFKLAGTYKPLRTPSLKYTEKNIIRGFAFE